VNGSARVVIPMLSARTGILCSRDVRRRTCQLTCRGGWIDSMPRQAVTPPRSGAAAGSVTYSPFRLLCKTALARSTSLSNTQTSGLTDLGTRRRRNRAPRRPAGSGSLPPPAPASTGLLPVGPRRWPAEKADHRRPAHQTPLPKRGQHRLKHHPHSVVIASSLIRPAPLAHRPKRRPLPPEHRRLRRRSPQRHSPLGNRRHPEPTPRVPPRPSRCRS
jgi:hypothetical protein